MNSLHPNDYSNVIQVRYFGLKHLEKNNSKVISAQLKKIEVLLATIAELESPLKEQAFVESILEMHKLTNLAA